MPLRTLPGELLRHAGRALVIYLFMALIGAGTTVLMAVTVPSVPSENAAPEPDQPQTSGEASATGSSWIDPR